MRVWIAASAAAVCAAPAAAQVSDPEPAAGNLDETIIVTGSRGGDFAGRSGIPLEQMPQSVQVIEIGDLAQAGIRSLEQALGPVPSATIAGNRVSGFGGSTLRLRGFSPQQIRNGIYQRFYDGTDPSALSNIERIEVLKGPSAVLFGQSGVGGVVSIVTKRPQAEMHGSFALTGGTHDQAMITLDGGGPLSKRLGLRLTAEVERSCTFVDHLRLARENLGLALAWRPAAGVSAHLVAEYLHRRTLHNPGLPVTGTVLGVQDEPLGRSTYLGEPGWSLQENHAPLVQAWVEVALGGSWTLTPRLQYSEWNNRVRSTDLQARDPLAPTLVPRIGRDAGERDRFYFAQIDLAGEARTGPISHALLFGLEWNHDRVPFTMRPRVLCGVRPIDPAAPAYGCGPPTDTFGFTADDRLQGYAVYLQDRLALGPRWHVVVGLRRSHAINDNRFITAFSAERRRARLDNTSWQIGSTYTLGAGLSVFGGYNTGFDLGAVTGSRGFDGTPFVPETSDQAEAGLRLLRRNVRATVSLFRVRRNNVPVGDPAHPGFQVQDGRFRTRGLEFEGEWSPAPGWSVQGGYAWLDAEIVGSSDPAMLGARLAETPAHTVTGQVRGALGPVELRIAGRAVGPRRMVNGGGVTLPGYAIVDIGAGTDLGPWRLDVALTNLLDRTWYFTDNASRYSLNTEDRVLVGEPRTLSVRASYRFGRGAS